MKILGGLGKTVGTSVNSYEDMIDILAFWEELNLGYYQMKDEFLMSQFLMSKQNFDPYNLSGRDLYYSYVLKK